MKFRPRATGLAVALAVAAPAALPAASPGAVFTQRCPNFTVVAPDPSAGFPQQGTYRRNNFSNSRSTILSCDATYHVLRSWLFDPSASDFRASGWDVGALRGGLRTRTGRRFTLRSSRGHVGFEVYR